MSIPQEVVQESLRDIISGKEPADDVVTEPKQEAKSEPEPKGEKEAAPPAAVVTEKAESKEPAKVEDKTPAGALIAMRQRLQAAENRVKELEAPKVEKPSVFDNEDEAISSRVREQIAPFQDTIYELKLELAKAKYPGFDDAARKFYETAQADPVLMHQAHTSPDVYAFVYREGNRLLELGPYGGDFAKYKESVVGERDAKIKALEAQVAELTQQKTDLESLPRSLNSKSSGAAPKAGDDDDEDIKSITRFGNKQR